MPGLRMGQPAAGGNTRGHYGGGRMLFGHAPSPQYNDPLQVLAADPLSRGWNFWRGTDVYP